MGASEITILLGKVRAGDKSYLNEIYSLLYKDIKAVAGHQLNLLSNTGETITATVLANECYLKLLKQQKLPDTDRRHFMQYLAKSMRTFLLDTIRAKNSQKRDGLQTSSGISEFVGFDDVNIRLMDIDRMLDLVEEVDSQLAEILQHKLIFNLTFGEIGEIIDRSERQVIRLWKQAKALLLSLLDLNDREVN
ncbi:MAG: ECF-type sigma factor [Proteobacteria bacterium]|nr:ECF-type sigma factor [Pseudomonadota bacterium]